MANKPLRLKRTRHGMAGPANPKLRPEDLPVEKVVDLFVDMPCEFTEEDFREEIEAYEPELSARRKPV
jgi:hypothetical protein